MTSHVTCFPFLPVQIWRISVGLAGSDKTKPLHVDKKNDHLPRAALQLGVAFLTFHLLLSMTKTNNYSAELALLKERLSEAESRLLSLLSLVPQLPRGEVSKLGEKEAKE